MKFIKKIREEILKINAYQMQKLMGLNSTRVYLNFENTKEALNAEKLVKLWHLSGLTADEFMKMIEAEVNKDNEDK